MQSNYQPFEFKISLGYPGSAPLSVRVHAVDRAQAWARVRQMHPRATEARPEARSTAAQGSAAGPSLARSHALSGR